MKPHRLLPLLILVCLSAHASRPEPLHSPWDSRPEAISAIPYTCPPAVPISPDISITARLDGDGNTTPDAVKEAAYAESTKALSDLAKHVVRAADNYRDTGSPAAATCVVELLAAAAEGHAMAGNMASKLAWQHQNSALRGAAIALLKVRSSGVMRPDQSSVILDWMTGIVEQERYYYENLKCGAKTCGLLGHSGLEVALATMAVGIARNDRGMFKWSVDQYRTAVESIGPTGTLPYDNKSQYALRWNIESAASLVLIAELAQANNENLYDYDQGRIHLLVHTVTRGLVDASPFRTANRADQVIASPPGPSEICWLTPYNVRFPDPVTTSLLQQIGPVGADVWGGSPPEPTP
jgi:poly(beta-D-mannuronate) lyase